VLILREVILILNAIDLTFLPQEFCIFNDIKLNAIWDGLVNRSKWMEFYIALCLMIFESTIRYYATIRPF